MNILDKIPKASRPLMAKQLSTFKGKLLVSKPRKSKFGDFKVNKKTGQSSISVNENLNEYAFLITLVHELAHYHTWKSYGSSIKPHGSEWQVTYQKLLKPHVESKVFPVEIHNALVKYIQKPKASSCSDQLLFESLETFNHSSDEFIFISRLTAGDKFNYQTKGQFEIIEKKRKRYLCKHLSSGKKYLFQPITKVELATHL